MSGTRGGGRFDCHGVATPVSSSRGTVATVDGAGRNVVLVWLFDHRGGYALLMIDAESGNSEEFPTPFAPNNDCPFASLLSGANKYYTHFNSHFVEFDPERRAFTFVAKSAPRVAMGMTEDDSGRIWAATYPNSGLMSFDPRSREFRDYGPVYKQNWPQYQRHVAADDAGWVYFSVGFTASQIVAFDPAQGRAIPLLSESERAPGSAYVYRDLDGMVYGRARQDSTDGWCAMRAGEARRVVGPVPQRPKPIVTGSQDLFHRVFPDGHRLKRIDFVERLIEVERPAGAGLKRARIEYSSEGAHIMSLIAFCDGSIRGGTAFPMCAFSFNPKSGEWTNRATWGQWNTMARQAERIYIGAYTGGQLLEWEPCRPWFIPADGPSAGPECNPRLLASCSPAINRPHVLLAHPDGRTVIMGGTPEYGHTGGGLLLWDCLSGTGTLLVHDDLLPDHSVASLAPLPGRRLLGGTTTRPGSGGEQKVFEAELFILAMDTRKIEWRGAAIPGAMEISELCPGPGGLVFGLACMDRFDSVARESKHLFFVFDPVSKRIVSAQDTESEFGPVGYQQGQRKLIPGPAGVVYVLFRHRVAAASPATLRLAPAADAPAPIDTGGDMLGDRI